MLSFLYAEFVTANLGNKGDPERWNVVSWDAEHEAVCGAGD